MAKGAFADIDEGVDDSVGPEPEQNKGPVVDLSADDDDDPVPGEPAEVAKSRKEKRSERYYMNREKEEDYQRRITAAEERAASAFAQAQAILQQAQAAPRQAEKPQTDPELDNLKRERALLDREYQLLTKTNSLTDAEYQRLQNKAVDLDEGIHRVIARQELRQFAPQQQTSQVHPQAAAIQAQVAVKFPEVSQALFTNQKAREFADGVHKQLMATGAGMWDANTIDTVMTRTAQAFGLGKHNRSAPREPSSNLRASLAGVPRSSSGGVSMTEGKVQLTKAEKVAADAAFKHMPEKTRYKHYLKVTSGNGERE
jgi:hypothetical protein